jgi:DNA repair protein RecN (Recombination protein N)
MLLHLSVKNYALIHQLELDLDSGFTIITGETGAGKSILLGAFSLILGNRAETSMLKESTEKCIVEGSFDISLLDLNDWFEKNDIDYNETLILRREIATNGKSRAFINDMPTSLNLMKELGDKLVDIHSQHQNLLLKDGEYQLNLLDLFASNQVRLESYRQLFVDWQTKKNELKELKNGAKKDSEDFEYLTFQLNQIESLNLIDGEQQELETEIEILSHAAEIKSNLSESLNIISNQENNISYNLSAIKTLLQSVSKYLTHSKEWHERIQSVLIEIKDIAGEIDVANERIEFNPDRQAFVNDRLTDIYKLQKKFNVSSITELAEIGNNLKSKLNLIGNYDIEIKKCEGELCKLFNEIKKNAEILSNERTKAAKTLEKAISDQCKLLGMPYASVKINILYSEDFTHTGGDIVEILFSANKNISAEKIEKVASGGELSRLMMVIKSLISQKAKIPTIIFDEIDTGVSGEIADKMGDVMQNIAKKNQIISITHLPQIAAKGNSHLRVFKSIINDQTITKIEAISGKERTLEIAKMLSGKEISDAAIKNAGELLNPKH